MTSMLIATGLATAALTYLAVIESRRAYQRGIEHEAYLTGIEQGIGVRRYYPTSQAPQPPDGLPAFNPHLPRTARLIRAAECRAAAYADGYYVGWFREELRDLDQLPVTGPRVRAA